MVEDKARDRVPSGDSARERNAVFRPQGPAVDRMGFFNGLLKRHAESRGQQCGQSQETDEPDDVGYGGQKNRRGLRRVLAKGGEYDWNERP